MKAITTINFESDDGAVFDTMIDCKQYEMIHGLCGHIEHNLCISDHTDGASSEDISNYIHQNIDVINSYVNGTHKVK